MVAEQENPLAPASHRIAINDDNSVLPPHNVASEKSLKRRRFIKCCGCTTAVLVILGVTILVLMLTLFKARDPKVKLNYVAIRGVESVNHLSLVPNTNVTILVGVSIKNPNAASFKFRNVTTNVYYKDVLIAEVTTPQGNANARKRFRTVSDMLRSRDGKVT